MYNAFKVLGAEPSDTTEKLSEILDEKQLLLDDTTNEQIAYEELTNPKKRIKHEILYIGEEDSTIVDLKKLIYKEVSKLPNTEELAELIVKAGFWFDTDCELLQENINDNRAESGYPFIDDINVIENAVATVRDEFKSELITLLDRISSQSLIHIFNYIVKAVDFQSFFVDDLMAYYENRMGEIINAKQDECKKLFGALESACNLLINGNPTYLQTKYNDFEKALKDWDTVLQPLQVNAQIYGGSHEGSADFVRDLRNRTINICNRAQELVLNQIKIMEKSSFPTQYGRVLLSEGAEARKKLPSILSTNISLLDISLKLSRLFVEVFAEIDQTAEQLKEDIKEISNLKTQLTSMKRDVEEAISQSNRSSQYRPTVRTGGCYVATCVYGSYDCPEVWTLRRYRDYKLAKTWYGRAFIKLYYAVSPTLVKLFGKTRWFKKMWKGKLDKMVKNLQADGFKNTPYDDKVW